MLFVKKIMMLMPLTRIEFSFTNQMLSTLGGSIKWEEDGESNSNFFHRTIKEKRRRSRIIMIKDSNDNWVEGNHAIFKVAMQYFYTLFTQPQEPNRSDILRWVDIVVTEEDNLNLHQILSESEIKDVVFSLDPNSAAGPDGYNGHFFPECLEDYQT